MERCGRQGWEIKLREFLRGLCEGKRGVNQGGQKEKWTKKKRKTKGKTRFKMAVNTCLSITALNVNGLNAAIKRHRVADGIKTNKQNKKQEPTIHWSQKTHFRAEDTNRRKVGIEKDISCKRK